MERVFLLLMLELAAELEGVASGPPGLEVCNEPLTCGRSAFVEPAGDGTIETIRAGIVVALRLTFPFVVAEVAPVARPNRRHDRAAENGFVRERLGGVGIFLVDQRVGCDDALANPIVFEDLVRIGPEGRDLVVRCDVVSNLSCVCRDVVTAMSSMRTGYVDRAVCAERRRTTRACP